MEDKIESRYKHQEMGNQYLIGKLVNTLYIHFTMQHVPVLVKTSDTTPFILILQPVKLARYDVRPTNPVVKR